MKNTLSHLSNVLFNVRSNIQFGIQKLILALVMALALVGLQSCQKSELTDLQEAQYCLNTSSAANAKDCVSKIAANTSSFANSLKCSAIFISEGFGTPSSFLTALESINSPESCTGTCSSTVNALNALKFTQSGDVTTVAGRAANNATAAEAFTACSQSNVKFYAQISSLFKIGTLTAMLAHATSGLTANPTQDQIKAELANLPPETIGEIVISTSAAVCGNITADTPAATKKYCDELAVALAAPSAAGGSATAIGTCLKLKLENPAATCS